MREYDIVRAPTPLNWEKVPTLAIDTPLWGTNADIGAWAQICWDDEGLLVRLRARERDIRAEYTRLTDMPCEDSCLEFFFSPRPGDSRYFNIEFNPNCCVYLGLCDGRDALVRLLPEGFSLEPQAERTADGWEVRYRVPFTLIRHFFPDFAPAKGDAMRANCFKCGELTPVPHYFSWNPCSSPEPEFHRQADFGLMCFA